MTYNYYQQPYGYNPIAPISGLNYNLPSQQNYQNYQNNSINNGFNWVQGESAARAFQVNPGAKALLLDSEKDVFYIKSVDMSGTPSPLRIFEYKEVFPDSTKNVAQAGQENSQYITKKEFEERLSEIEDLLK